MLQAKAGLLKSPQGTVGQSRKEVPRNQQAAYIPLLWRAQNWVCTSTGSGGQMGVQEGCMMGC